MQITHILCILICFLPFPLLSSSLLFSSLTTAGNLSTGHPLDGPGGPRIRSILQKRLWPAVWYVSGQALAIRHREENAALLSSYLRIRFLIRSPAISGTCITYIYIYIYIYIYVCVHVVYTYMCIWPYVYYVYTHVYTCVHTHTYTYSFLKLGF